MESTPAGAALMQADERHTVWAEHARIIDAVNSGDAVLAAKPVRTHGENTSPALEGGLDRNVQHGS